MALTLSDAALDVLTTASPIEKANKTRAYASQWRAGGITEIGSVTLPNRPARPQKPELLELRDMPKRGKAGSKRAKIALLHALAHIELNAIDLAWDVMARQFPCVRHSGGDAMHRSNIRNPYESLEEAHLTGSPLSERDKSRRGDDDFVLPKEFCTDWIKVADDEAKHHLMLEERLNDLGASYGDLPAHDGLWEASEKTAHDFAARLAIVPMVLEARGLDVTPNMIKIMKGQGDDKTAEYLQIIHDDEITHVRAGTVWFEAWCAHHGRDVEEYWQHLVKTYFNGRLKSPFNHPSREDAGMIRDWYEPLADIDLSDSAA
ncbi:MAG: ferritin-like domain-containing protein [Alphaproteobacteria bacterium]